jgi:hypothetical protein
MGHEYRVRAFLPDPAAFDVSTSLTDWRSRPGIDCSMRPLLGFTLRSISLSLGPVSLSRSEREPCRTSTDRLITVRCPPAVYECAGRRSNRGKSHSFRLLGLAPSESPSIVRGRNRARFVAPLGLASPRISPSRPRSRLHGSSAPGLRMVGVIPHDAAPQRFLCKEVSFPSPSVHQCNQTDAVGLLPFMRFVRSHFGMNSEMPNRRARTQRTSSNHDDTCRDVLKRPQKHSRKTCSQIRQPKYLVLLRDEAIHRCV